MNIKKIIIGTVATVAVFGAAGVGHVRANVATADIAKNAKGIWTGYAANGSILKGQQKAAGSWYQFSNTGAVEYGQQKGANGNWYLFNRSSGKMMYGQQKDGGHWYLFNRSSGKMTYGLVKDVNGKTYYFNPKSGVMTYGWVAISNVQKDYFDTKTGVLSKTQSTAHANGWFAQQRDTGDTITINGQVRPMKITYWIYYQNGVLAQGLVTLPKRTYYNPDSYKAITAEPTVYFENGESIDNDGINGLEYISSKHEIVYLANTLALGGEGQDELGVVQYGKQTVQTFNATCAKDLQGPATFNSKTGALSSFTSLQEKALLPYISQKGAILAGVYKNGTLEVVINNGKGYDIDTKGKVSLGYTWSIAGE